ncbi:unnamed protein product [Amoebophrya sp. A120]|nr:unnamed protein product [Amoebophrya sp. A120]|eukprot:GSA120T00015153001.1
MCSPGAYGNGTPIRARKDVRDTKPRDCRAPPCHLASTRKPWARVRRIGLRRPPLLLLTRVDACKALAGLAPAPFPCVRVCLRAAAVEAALTSGGLLVSCSRLPPSSFLALWRDGAAVASARLQDAR